MPIPATATAWRRSTRCGPSGTCVEIADLGTRVLVRDSRRAHMLILTRGQAAALITAVRHG